jgi:hypothetical protein
VITKKDLDELLAAHRSVNRIFLAELDGRTPRIERAVLEKWRAEAKSLEHPQAHPDVPRPGGYEASQRMLALIAEIDRLEAELMASYEDNRNLRAENTRLGPL